MTPFKRLDINTAPSDLLDASDEIKISAAGVVAWAVRMADTAVAYYVIVCSETWRNMYFVHGDTSVMRYFPSVLECVGKRDASTLYVHKYLTLRSAGTSYK